jgi:hypothetical protein
VAVIDNRAIGLATDAFLELEAMIATSAYQFEYKDLTALKEQRAALSVPATREEVGQFIEQLAKSTRWPSHEVVEDKESAKAFLKRRVFSYKGVACGYCRRGCLKPGWLYAARPG